ncbi:MAG TPA: XRE family transcriptional regulator [Candidatus Saccharimonadales bacterium]|jgi:hypothetical protein|nr:XRE family transcriptional regulator [Candidatus Saccharimonadales bacterium]
MAANAKKDLKAHVKRRERVEAHVHAMKVEVAKDITKIIAEAGMTQTEAAYHTGEAPSQWSLITTGKLRGFSLERLIRDRALLSPIAIQIGHIKRKVG